MIRQGSSNKEYVRGMMQAQQGFGYVTNGLILHLDGINKGTTPNHWDSLVGGHSFENFGAISNADNFQFSGSQYLSCDTFDGIGMMVGTIEIVANYDSSSHSNMILFFPKYADMLCFGCYNKKNILFSTTNMEIYQALSTNILKGTMSINDDRMLYNGNNINRQTNTGSYGGYDNTKSYIGKRNTSTPNSYYGKIYSIRIYNRKLSESEMLNNYNVDHNRFNL